MRNLWTQIRNDPNARKEFLTQLYGHATPELEHIFDKIGGAPEPVAPLRPAKLPKTAKPAGGLVKSVAKSVAKKGIKEDELDHSWAFLNRPSELNIEYANYLTLAAKEIDHPSMVALHPFIAVKENNQLSLDSYIARQDRLRSINIRNYIKEY